ncbi:MAG: DegT/DnrJ/EryC1/StrS family aminotransferase [Candidatus Sumerlaeaceae bacterium]|nr:DegT/DnrJ/EryC1/StrS family aminotransferase [Candidatus Sumerlaeaceae bacterium]
MKHSPVKVRFNDILAAYHEAAPQTIAAIARVLERGDFIMGRAVHDFEKEFAAYCGAQFCVGCSSGTTALHLALLAAGIGPGDEVITTPMTFIATSEAIGHAGAKVVFADIDRETLNLDPRAVEAAITPKTRAVIFVHLHGNPSGILEIAELCRRHGLLLIEDCAQAHGAFVAEKVNQLRHAGTFGRVGCFSFFPAKNLGAFGDAGAIITNDQQIALQARRLLNHGRQDKYLHLVEGFNYRLDTIQAAVLLLRLKSLSQSVLRRNGICVQYQEGLAGLPLTFQKLCYEGVHARHLFAIGVEQRDLLQKFLSEHGIETGIHYPIPLHLQPAYAHREFKQGQFPIAEKVAATTLSLPLYPQLPPEQVDYVIEKVRAFFGD